MLVLCVGQTAGSGFIIDETGLIATNAHVVSQAGELKLTLYDGRELKGKVHSMDLATDLALVQVTDRLSEKLPTMKIGCSASLRPGKLCECLTNRAVVIVWIFVYRRVRDCARISSEYEQYCYCWDCLLGCSASV